MSLDEYASRYGTTYTIRTIDWYTNGIVDAEHYIDTEYIAVEQQQESGPQIWYYMYKSDGGPHGLVYDPYTNTIYDVNHPNNGNTNGLKSWLNGGAKSTGYKFNMPKDANAFWNFGGGRGTLFLAPVTVTNPTAATAFFKSNTGEDWDYNFFTNNCKHYACQGFKAGDASISPLGPDPGLWRGTFTMYWNSSMAAPAPLQYQQPYMPSGSWPIMDKR